MTAMAASAMRRFKSAFLRSRKPGARVSTVAFPGFPFTFVLPRGLLERHADRRLSHPVYLLRQAVFLVRLSAGMCWGADANVRARFALAPYAPDPGTFRDSTPAAPR